MRGRYIEIRRHTMRVKPGQHLSQAGVDRARRIGDGMGRFDRVITSEIPRAFETAIAMGYAVQEQYALWNFLPDGAEDEVAWDAGFAAIGQVVRQGGVIARLAQETASFLNDLAESLPAEGRVLIVTHGGLVEAAAVGCLPEADHAAWGGVCDYCEGVRLHYEDGQFTRLDVLRVDHAAE